MAQKDEASRDLLEYLAQSVAPHLRQYLRRHRLLASYHDDLVQETLADLIEYIRARERNPPSDAEASALAFTILKRRIADQFRQTARRVVESLPPDRLPSVADSHDVEAAVGYRKLLWAVLSLLVDLSAEEQKLLLRGQLQSQSPSFPLTPAERKRVERLVNATPDLSPYIHLFLAGHTHASFPGAPLPRTVKEAYHGPLGDRQMQLVAGPLMLVRDRLACALEFLYQVALIPA